MFRLAMRSILGAGLRTWLSVLVLSFTFVIIIWQLGLVEGWHQQALNDLIDWEVAGGQYWHNKYDPYDTFTIDKGNGPIPQNFLGEQKNTHATPILVAMATIYPNNRMQNTIIKGIDPEQTIIKLPTASLKSDISQVPVLIGERMAKETKLSKGDTFTIRWRDGTGAYDAADAQVIAIMKTKSPNVDQGQIWLSINQLQNMLKLPGHASLVVLRKNSKIDKAPDDWVFHSQASLSQNVADLVMMEKVGDSVFFAILLAMALLAVFDTQVLAIFRRRKEIGTLIALGMTKNEVVKLFTIEGTMHGILALVVGAIWGLPLLIYTSNTGITMPENIEGMGMGVPDVIYPVYGPFLIFGTIVVILLSVTVVSFFPARQIAQLNPTDAIRGKIS